jgi:hypothetical protein
VKWRPRATSSNGTDRQPNLGEFVVGTPTVALERFVSSFKRWLLSERIEQIKGPYEKKGRTVG